MVSLRLVPVSGSPIDVTRDPSMVGRDPSCEVVVQDGSVSRRHARLELRKGEWWVVDQGSANGTYVNSLKIAETALKHHQELRFGALAFRVDIQEDPEATVASPVLPDSEETVMAAPAPPPPPPPVAQPTAPQAAAPPPPPPPAAPAAGARDRGRGGGAAPVPQMSGGAPPARKGRSPFFWIAVGCCGCILVVLLLGGLLGGGAFLMTKGVADDTHAWLDDVRQGRTDEAVAGLTNEYRARLTPTEIEELTSVIGASTDATFPSRSVNNDRAVLSGVLTGSGPARTLTIQLVKEGDSWKVDDVRLEDVAAFGE